MEKHRMLSDDHFERQFADCSLDPAIFTHEAHLKLAWIHIRKYGIDRAIKNVCTQIRQFATFHGDAGKFHTTITIAAVRAVYHFMLQSETIDFESFIKENPRLKTNFKDLLFSHYSTNIFESVKARKEYLEPELLPFD